MTRAASELTPSARLLILSRALSGEVLTGWWAVNWSAARSHIVSAGGGWADQNSHGERKSDGVHVWFKQFGPRYFGPPASVHETNFEARVRKPDVIMTWKDVREYVMAGATQDRRKAYTDAYGEYVEHATKPLPRPYLRPGQRRELGLPEEDYDQHCPENEAHWAEGSRIRGELSAAGSDILQAGVGLVVAKEEAEPVQGLLW